MEFAPYLFQIHVLFIGKFFQSSTETLFFHDASFKTFYEFLSKDFCAPMFCSCTLRESVKNTCTLENNDES